MQHIGIIRAFCLPGGTALKKTLWPLFYGWGSTASRLQPLWGSSLLFTIQFAEIPGTAWGPVKSFNVLGDRKNCRIWFAGRISTQADTEIYCSKTFHQVICIRVFRFEYQLHLVLILVWEKRGRAVTIYVFSG